MKHKSKLKISILAGLMMVIVQIGLFGADSSRYNYDVKSKTDLDHVTITLINNTKYSLWLTVKEAVKLHRLDIFTEKISNDYDPDDDTSSYPFGKVWIGPGERVSVDNDKEASENGATLFYAMDPDILTYGKVVYLDFKGRKSTASESPDIKVTIKAEPVYIFYDEIFYSAAYLYEWYNYTIIVDSKNDSEKIEM